MKKNLIPLFITCLFLFACGSNNEPVVLPSGVEYTTGYSADGYLSSGSDGKTLTFYPRNSVFTNTYVIKKGNELWSEYGKVANISMSKNGNIRIYNCSNSHMRSILGHTWKKRD